MNRVFHTEGATPSWRSTGGLLVFGYSAIVGGLVLVNVLQGPLRVVLTAPLLGFLPGYAVLDALFPKSTPTAERKTGRMATVLSWGARVALSTGLSMVLLAILVVLLGSAGVPLTTAPITVALLLVVAAGITIGSFRRIRHGATEGYRIPTQQWRAELRAATIRADSRIDAALTLVLVLVIVLAMTGFAYGLAAPDRDASYTEVALLNQQGNELVAGDYPDAVPQGEPIDVTLTIENQEGVETEYTFFFVLERVRTSGDTVQVLERQQLERRTVTVADGETWQNAVTVEPNMLGEDLRMSVYVVEGNTPDTIDTATADHHLYLWVDVGATAGTDDAASVDASSNLGSTDRVTS